MLSKLAYLLWLHSFIKLLCLIGDKAKFPFIEQEEVLLFIPFDENGIAAECAEGYRPGG